MNGPFDNSSFDNLAQGVRFQLRSQIPSNYNDGTALLYVDASGNLRLRNAAATSTETIGGGVVTVAFADSPYTVLDSDRTILVNTVGGAVTLTLPASPALGRTLRIIDRNLTFDTNNCTISGNGKNINGAATLVLSNEAGGVEIVYGGVTWERSSAAAGGAVVASGITFPQTYATADGTIATLTTTTLTDNGGGTADGTVASMAPPATLTDSTGLSGTHDDTLAATTVPAALTENTGAIGGTSDGNLPALVDPAGDAGASVIAGIRENATRCNVLTTLIGVIAQNGSDTAQKTIEIVTLLTAIQNNFKEVTTQIAAMQADILAMKKNDNKIIDALQAAGLAT